MRRKPNKKTQELDQKQQRQQKENPIKNPKLDQKQLREKQQTQAS